MLGEKGGGERREREEVGGRERSGNMDAYREGQKPKDREIRTMDYCSGKSGEAETVFLHEVQAQNREPGLPATEADPRNSALEQ